MRARPYKMDKGRLEPCLIDEATHVMLHLPGPLPNRLIPVQTRGKRHGTPNWTWNGDTELPTLRPSILTKGADASGDHVCHSWVNEGKVKFLNDCTHELAGQTLDLLEVEE